MGRNHGDLWSPQRSFPGGLYTLKGGRGGGGDGCGLGRGGGGFLCGCPGFGG